jgi:hypothetical protein
MSELKPVDLNDLPKYSMWVKRLFDRNQKKYTKNLKEIYREYENDKYSEILSKAREHVLSLDQLDSMQYQNIDEIIISIKDRLYLTSPLNARLILISIIIRYLQKGVQYEQNIVELGAGIGSNILRIASHPSFINQFFSAGDFSKSSLDIMEILSKQESLELSLFNFNFDNEEDYFAIPINSLVFTSFSLAYAQNLSGDTWKYFFKAKIKKLFLFEPIYQHYKKEDMISVLREAYFNFNDYSTNIIPSLEIAKQRKILSYKVLEYNSIGLNPLCPISIIRVDFNQNYEPIE